MIDYLRANLWAGLRTSPFKAPLKAWALAPLFALVALPTGFATGLFTVEPLDSALAPLLPLTLFVFPSLLEEAVFRGVLIPRDIINRGKAAAVRAGAISTVVFVLWHPLNALTVNPTAIPLFLDPWFLFITVALGIACSYGYIVSRSVWVPVIIHWATVTVWVLLLGGRNLVLAQ